MTYSRSVVKRLRNPPVNSSWLWKSAAGKRQMIGPEKARRISRGDSSRRYEIPWATPRHGISAAMPLVNMMAAWHPGFYRAPTGVALRINVTGEAELGCRMERP